jgi:hypothetical protein
MLRLTVSDTAFGTVRRFIGLTGADVSNSETIIRRLEIPRRYRQNARLTSFPV